MMSIFIKVYGSDHKFYMLVAFEAQSVEGKSYAEVHDRTDESTACEEK